MGSSESKGSEDHEKGEHEEGHQKLSCTPTTGGKRRRHHKRTHRTHRKRSHSRRHSRRR